MSHRTIGWAIRNWSLPLDRRGSRWFLHIGEKVGLSLAKDRRLNAQVSVITYFIFLGVQPLAPDQFSPILTSTKVARRLAGSSYRTKAGPACGTLARFVSGANTSLPKSADRSRLSEVVHRHSLSWRISRSPSVALRRLLGLGLSHEIDSSRQTP